MADTNRESPTKIVLEWNTDLLLGSLELLVGSEPSMTVEKLSVLREFYSSLPSRKHDPDTIEPKKGFIYPRDVISAHLGGRIVSDIPIETLKFLNILQSGGIPTNVLHSVTGIRRLNALGVDIITFPSPSSAKHALTVLENHPWVLSISEDLPVDLIHPSPSQTTTPSNSRPPLSASKTQTNPSSIQYIPDDPLVRRQWHLETLGMFALWSQTPPPSHSPPPPSPRSPSPDVLIALIDTGMKTNHEDLGGTLWVNSGEIPDNGVDDDGNGYVDDYHGYDFAHSSGSSLIDQGTTFVHGTHVAGVIASQPNNQLGTAGVAWGKVKLMPLRFLVQDPPVGQAVTLSMAVEAINYAAGMGADMANHSWRVRSISKDWSRKGDMVRTAIRNTQHMLHVAASGNDNLTLKEDNNSYPAGLTAEFENVVSVGAANRSLRPSNFSNSSPTYVDTYAPGQAIMSTFHTKPLIGPEKDAYKALDGTSMAAPQVTAAAALALYEARVHGKKLSPGQLKALLVSKNATNRDVEFTTKCRSGGILDIMGFMAEVQTVLSKDRTITHEERI